MPSLIARLIWYFLYHGRIIACGPPFCFTCTLVGYLMTAIVLWLGFAGRSHVEDGLWMILGQSIIIYAGFTGVACSWDKN